MAPAWEVEHHGAAEFSWSSAPDVFLSWLSQHTRRLRPGHAGVLAPFRVDHPARRRLELELARSGGSEWHTLGVEPATTRQDNALAAVRRRCRRGGSRRARPRAKRSRTRRRSRRSNRRRQ